MGLTRPRISQFDTSISSISDPITVLNKSSTLANIDVGFLINRDGGISSNVALYWSETAKSFTLAYTTSTGETNSNIAVTSYANLTLGNVTSSGNITASYFIGSGQFLTSLPGYAYSNVNTKSYTESMAFTNYSNVNVTAYLAGSVTTGPLTVFGGAGGYFANITGAAAGPYGGSQTWRFFTQTGFGGPGSWIQFPDTSIQTTAYPGANTSGVTSLTLSGDVTALNFVGSGAYLSSLPGYAYSNVNVKAYTETMAFTNYSNVNVAALITTNGLTNYSNVNLTAYLGGAVTIGGNLTVNGNLFINGNTSVFNTNNLSINDALIYLADDNPADTLDIGFVSAFTSAVRYQHTGFVRDASDGVWKLFANVVAEPTTTIDFTNANYSSLYVGNIQTVASATVGSTLNVSGQAFVGELFVTTRAGQEGGQLNLAPSVTNNILSGNVIIDVYDNNLRIFESSGTNRGAYINIAALTSAVGTNLVGGGGGTPGGGNGQLQFNQSSAFAGAASLYYFGANGAIIANAGIASTSTSTGTFQITGGIGVTGNVYADMVSAGNNGNGQNFKVGDDIWIGDVNIANTMGIKGQQDATQGYIRFGTTQTNALGVNGAGPLTWTGNLSAGTVGAVSGQYHTFIGNITQSTSGGAVYFNTSGNILAASGVLNSLAVNGNITVSSAYIVPSANAGASLGTSATRWNYIYGVYGNFLSVNANYADLAEIYTSDQQYPGGTVVVFGGSAEVMQSHSSHDPRIAGVVSTNPAYLMNSSESGVPVALQGRVPCRVLGPIEQGDRVVSSHIPGVAQRLDPQQYEPGCVIGKALQAIDSTDISVIEVVVGRV